ncbi:hypothetical protein FACS1894201_11820 [Bacteroidia bacterium]|nr:hypothetical protein FACS1894201_11820 [Bacteroidia bacterium]
MTVMVNFNDQLRVRGENMSILELKRAAKDFIQNPYGDIHKSELAPKEVDGLGTVNISKGVISLQNDNNTSYEMYIKVQNELTAAFNELRDELSKEHFGVKFSDLTQDSKRDAIQEAVPMRISEAEPKDYGGKK